MREVAYRLSGDVEVSGVNRHEVAMLVAAIAHERGRARLSVVRCRADGTPMARAHVMELTAEPFKVLDGLEVRCAGWESLTSTEFGELQSIANEASGLYSSPKREGGVSAPCAG